MLYIDVMRKLLSVVTKTLDQACTVYFTVKGQVVIPSWLRKELGIQEGTRATIYRENDHVVLKPMTLKCYDQMQGCLKGKGVLKALMEDRKRERDL